MTIAPLLLLLPCLAAGAPAGGAATARPATAYRFDGFKLGDTYSQVMARKPYDGPCDNDPTDNQKRRFMVYGGLPCRGSTFPESTTVMFFVRMGAPRSYAEPIQAFGFLHGQYFRKRSDFPIHPGDTVAQAIKVFGTALGTMTIQRKRAALTVHRFKGDVQVLASGTTVRGIVVGPMPTDPANEQWRDVMQMYDRYTPQAP
jgi:hypothetical protein